MTYLTIHKNFNQVIRIIMIEKDLKTTDLCICCEEVCIYKLERPYIGIPGAFSKHIIDNETITVLHICYKCYIKYKEYIDDLCRIYFRHEMFDVHGPIFKIKEKYNIYIFLLMLLYFQ